MHSMLMKALHLHARVPSIEACMFTMVIQGKKP